MPRLKAGVPTIWRPAKTIAPASGLLETRDYSQQRRLARTAGAEQGHIAVAGNVEVDVVERERRGIALGQAGNMQNPVTTNTLLELPIRG